MALPILDGNQSATTLSTILLGGEHTPAHTVVSLGSTAISNITSAISGSVVSISNFPATQTIAGTVTANPTGTQTIAGTVTANINTGVTIGGSISTQSIYPVAYSTVGGMQVAAIGSGLPISGTVTANGSRTFVDASGVTVSGFMTVGGWDVVNAQHAPIPVNDGATGVRVCYDEISGVAFPISGTVTVGSSVTIGSCVTHGVTIANTSVTVNGTFYQATQPVSLASLPSLAAGTNQIGSVTASITGTIPVSISSVTVGNSVTIGSIPAISGTVTANTFAIQGTAVTTSNFTSTTASTVLANYNATRRVLTIFNEGAGNLHICAGATCTTVAYQVRLSSGDYYEVPNHQTTITHSAVFATAGTARVTQVY